MMTNYFQHQNGQSVYPGAYVLLPETNQQFNSFKDTGRIESIEPGIIMDELENCYKIEVLIPGVHREDFLLHAHENLLTIVVIHKQANEKQNETLQPEMENRYFERQIALPSNADTEFMSANYNPGILCLHVSKCNKPLQTTDNQIVVY